MPTGVRNRVSSTKHHWFSGLCMCSAAFLEVTRCHTLWLKSRPAHRWIVPCPFPLPNQTTLWHVFFTLPHATGSEGQNTMHWVRHRRDGVRPGRKQHPPVDGLPGILTRGIPGRSGECVTVPQPAGGVNSVAGNGEPVGG